MPLVINLLMVVGSTAALASLDAHWVSALTAGGCIGMASGIFARMIQLQLKALNKEE